MKKLPEGVPFSNKKKEESLVELTTQVSNVNDQLVEVSSQLAQKTKQVGVNVDDFTGANDTTKFYNANVYALTNNEKITLTRDLILDANIQNNFEVASIDGNGKTITVNNKVRLFIGDKCKFIKNVNIIDTKFYAKTDYVAPNQGEWDYGYIFEQKADTFVNSFEVSNVTLKGTADTATGANRIRGLMEVCGNNININKCVINDCRSGFRVQKNTYLTKSTKGLVVKDVYFYNVEQCILFFSTKDVKIENLSLTNTQQQASNYTNGMGSDLLNFMYSDDIHIKNITTNYAVERTIYAINTNNVVVDGFIINNTGLNGMGAGIKFSAGYGTFATNTKIMNGLFTGAGRAQCFDLYNVDGITIDNVDVKATSGMYNHLLNISQKVKNVKVKNCECINFESNVIYGSLFSTTDLGGSNVPIQNLFQNISIEDCYFLNPVDINSLNPRSFVGFGNPESKSYTDETFFLFDGFTFENNTVIQTLDGTNLNVGMLEANSKLLSLCGNFKLKNLTYSNNRVIGNRTDGFFSQLLSSSTGSINGEVKMIETGTAPIPAGVIPFKCDTDVEIVQSNGYYKNKLIVRNQKYECDINMSYTPNANEVRYVYRSSATYPTYNAVGEIQYEDGTFEKFKIVNTGGVITLAHVVGDGTLSNGNITFPNGSQIELGPTYKELRTRSGATPKQYYLKVNVKI